MSSMSSGIGESLSELHVAPLATSAQRSHLLGKGASVAHIPDDIDEEQTPSVVPHPAGHALPPSSSAAVVVGGVSTSMNALCNSSNV
jgi:hypothetical protein